MGSGARLIHSKQLYDGQVVRLRLDRVVEPGGVEATREIVEHQGSVVVMPRLPKNRIILVRQFRYPARQPLWELVAGSMEAGESVTRAAHRELREETGYRARVIKPLLSFYPSPGFLTERMHLVEARDLTRSRAEPESDERIRVGEFSFAEVKRLIRRKKIKDGKTLVGLLWALLEAT